MRIFAATAVSWALLMHGANALTIDFGGDPNEALVYLSENGPGADALGFFEGFVVAVEIRGVTPDPKDGAVSGTATTGSTTLQFGPLGFDNGVAAGIGSGTLSDLDGVRGDWDVTLTDGTDTLQFQLAGIGDVQPPDRVDDAKVTDGFATTTPTLSYTVPQDAVTAVALYDVLNRNAATNRATFIESAFLQPGTGSFQVPEGLIQENGLYAFAFSTGLGRPAGTTNPSGSSQEGGLLVQNTSYVFFTPLDPDQVPPGMDELYLPTATETTDGIPTYIFNNPVFANQVAYYDPILAIGYDYEIGAGDPFFNSVVLPDVGDGLFEIFLKDDDGLLVSLGQVEHGEEFEFVDGTDFFRVLGIELDAGVDPFDPTAFVTGLSFVSDGRFTGSMTPIVQDTTPIPLPASAWMLLCAVGLLASKRAPSRS